MDQQNEGIYLGDRIVEERENELRSKIVWDTCCVEGCDKHPMRECEECVPGVTCEKTTEIGGVKFSTKNRMCLDHAMIHLKKAKTKTGRTYAVRTISVCPGCKERLEGNGMECPECKSVNVGHVMAEDGEVGMFTIHSKDCGMMKTDKDLVI